MNRCPRSLRSRPLRWLLGLAAAALTVLFLVAFCQAHAAARTIPATVERIRSRAGFVPIDDVPPVFRDVLIQAEDRHFDDHHGVDWPALRTAIWADVKVMRAKYGGSTITMQVARYLWLGRQRTVLRKLTEILLAGELEERLSKDELLELYLNSAKFGLGAYDIGTAAERYFGRPLVDLTTDEQCFLIGVLPEPALDWSQIDDAYVARCLARVAGRLEPWVRRKYDVPHTWEVSSIRLRLAPGD